MKKPTSTQVIETVERLTDSQLTVQDLHKNTLMLAEQIGYGGKLDIVTLQEEARFYRARTMEDCLELGKRLLLVKEMLPHGDFIDSMADLDIAPRTAQRFMQAALKFSKTVAPTILNHARSTGHMLELLTLDDDEIEELSGSGSVLGISLDDLQTMTTRQLRDALKEARADSTAKDQLLAEKDQKINRLDTQLTRQQNPSQSEAEAQAEADRGQALDQMQRAVNRFISEASLFNRDMLAARDLSEDPFIEEQFFANVRMSYQSLAQRLIDQGIDVDFADMVTPAWLQQGLAKLAQAQSDA